MTSDHVTVSSSGSGLARCTTLSIKPMQASDVGGIPSLKFRSYVNFFMRFSQKASLDLIYNMM